jgi:hypothetical protein
MRASTCHPPPHMTHDMHVSSSSAGYQYACQHMSLACFIAPIHSLISRLRPLLAPLPPSPPCLPLGISLCSFRNFHILQPGAASISSSLVVPPGHSTRPVARPSFPSSFNYSRTLASCAPRPTPPLIKAWKWGIVMYGMQRAPKAQLASAYARASHGETDRVPGRSQTCCAAERLEVGAKVEAGSLPAGTVRRERGKGDRQAGCVRTRSAWSKKSDVVIS